MISRKEYENLCFSLDFELFYHFRKLRKISFQKINRFFVNFSSHGSCQERLLVQLIVVDQSALEILKLLD
jgi:hypothetical protein